MTALQLSKAGWRSYETADGLVSVMFFQNAAGARWRVADFRGASPETPKPMELVLSWHQTKAAAVTAANAATWHLS